MILDAFQIFKLTFLPVKILFLIAKLVIKLTISIFKTENKLRKK